MTYAYCPDQVVTAYTGEVGDFRRSDFFASFRCVASGQRERQYGFSNRDGPRFVIGDQYTGGRFLYYDGHPGYDYRTRDQRLNGTLCPSGNVCSNGETPSARCSSRPRGLRESNRMLRGPGEIKIDHRNGYLTIYLHLSASRVVVGDEVSTGQVIGISCAVGALDNPHPHFEVRRLLNKILVPVDPYGWEGTQPDPHTRAPNARLWR